jgi:pilus assembly protein CpaE
MARILVAEDDAQVLRLLEYTLKQAGHQVVTARDGREAIRRWEDGGVDLMLLDVTLPRQDGYEVATHVRSVEAGQRHVPIIMLTVGTDVQQKVRGLRAGADDYLAKPVHQAELLARMNSLLTRFTQQSMLKPRLGRLIAVYGAKGGAGATTIAINTAIALQRDRGRKVVLVDGVLQFGDHRVFLDIGNDARGVKDAAAAPGIDTEFLRSILVTHDSGIDLLLAPTSPEEADLVSEERFAEVIRELRRMYDYVVVDVDKRLSDLTLSILEHADEIHAVLTADLSCLKNTRLLIDTMGRIGIQGSRLRLVLNRATAHTGISASAAEGALRRKFDFRFPNEYRVATVAQNTGTPIVMSDPESSLGREFAALAKAIDASEVRQIPARVGLAED